LGYRGERMPSGRTGEVQSLLGVKRGKYLSQKPFPSRDLPSFHDLRLMGGCHQGLVRQRYECLLRQ